MEALNDPFHLRAQQAARCPHSTGEEIADGIDRQGHSPPEQGHRPGRKNLADQSSLGEPATFPESGSGPQCPSAKKDPIAPTWATDSPRTSFR